MIHFTWQKRQEPQRELSDVRVTEAGRGPRERKGNRAENERSLAATAVESLLWARALTELNASLRDEVTPQNLTERPGAIRKDPPGRAHPYFQMAQCPLL